MTPLETIGFSWGINVIIWIFAFLRLHTQLTKARRRLSASDWITLAVVGTSFANTCVNTRLLVLNQRGMDMARTPFHKVLPVAALETSDYHEYWKLAFSAALITYGELWGIKATFCAIYLELANRLSLALKIALGVLIAINVGTFIVSFHAVATECRPLPRIWKSVFDPEYCQFYNNRILTIYFWASSAADVSIILFSLTLIFTLRMRARFVRSMFFVIFVGCISIAASIARFVSLLRVLKKPLEISNNAEIANVWAHIEFLFGFIASCLPVFRVYLRERSPSARGSSTGKWSARVARGIGMESWSFGLSTKSSGGNTARRSVLPGDHDEDNGNIMLVEQGEGRARESRETHGTDQDR
ncbi:hypothetical protein EDC01DRAFT_515900 [Geopyxis carbonaria]|nr:hypothetical protein EDC01DRAFT_515900 [Geopyxis carbonaria]